MTASAAARWAEELAAWRIDPDILAAAEESPYSFPPELFRVDPEATPEETPSTARAREELPEGGSVLDVGCGGGAAGLALAPPAAVVIGVDANAELLAEFRAAAERSGLSARALHGRWPDVAEEVPVCDIAVSHHVAYNVTDLAAFAIALTAHARHRVVLELTAAHPWAPLGPLWRHFHGQDRPAGPTAELAAQVLTEAGLDVHREDARRAARTLPPELAVAFTRRRLCLPATREPEVAELLRTHPPDPARHVVTLWWRGGGAG